MRPTLLAAILLAAAPCWGLDLSREGGLAVAGDREASVRRMARLARVLSSDELEGRGLETAGLDLAAERIAEELRAAGLRTDAVSGGAFQEFDVTVAATLGPASTAAIVGPDVAREPLTLVPNLDFTPLALGGRGVVDAELVFGGYGIAAPELEYDDYAGLEVAGRVVVLLRHEPQQADPHSVFDGTENSRHAALVAKVGGALRRGAAAAVVVTDPASIALELARWRDRRAKGEATLVDLRARLAQEPPGGADVAELRKQIDREARLVARCDREVAAAADPILPFDYATGAEREAPVLSVRPSVIDRVLKGAGKPSLAELQRQIDSDLKPRSFALARWRLAASADVDRRSRRVRNVVGVVEGRGVLASEAVVVGAHYDHLGRGEVGSSRPDSRDIHNGADDNASGVVALVETARRFARLDVDNARRIVFVAFTGEERGLLGSAAYVRTPVAPIEQTYAMVNYDMVGRLTENKLLVSGVGTGAGLEALVDRANARHAFELAKSPGGFGPSDHASFAARRVPVLHLFTGNHPEYHTPDDDFGLLNLEGTARVVDFAVDVVESLATATEAMAFVEAKGPSIAAERRGKRPYFGSIPAFGVGGAGYALAGVAPGSPADEAGLLAGDRIVRLADQLVANLEDFDAALREFEAGDRVDVEVVRDGESVKLEVMLAPPR
ncbi:MAG: M28 family peptidase [Lacipirellulaceae bacterium]